MALPVPNLDDRRFQDLVDDAKRLVQQRCPEWTDHNVSDPGVTLIETFAWMTDQVVYRLNRVPDRNYVKFLELIGVSLYPPTAARAPMTFWLSAAAARRRSRSRPAPRSPRSARTPTRRSRSRTVEDLPIIPSELAALGSMIDGKTLRDHMAALEKGTEVYCFQKVPSAGRRAVHRPVRGGPVERGPPPVQAPTSTASASTRPTRRSPGRRGPATTGSRASSTPTPPAASTATATSCIHVPHGHVVSLIAEAARRLAAGAGDGAGRGPARLQRLAQHQGPRRRSRSAAPSTRSTPSSSPTRRSAISEGVPGPALPAQARAGGARRRRPPCSRCAGDEGWDEWTLRARLRRQRPRRPALHARPVDGRGPARAGGPPGRRRAAPLRRGARRRAPTSGCAQYRTGGGRRATSRRGAISVLKSSIPFVSRVENRRPARGGVDGEDIENAKIRGPILLRTRGRAVTTEDYEQLAREAAPEVARVRAVAAGDGADAGVGAGADRAVGRVRATGRLRFDQLVPNADTLQKITDRLEESRVIGHARDRRAARVPRRSRWSRGSRRARASNPTRLQEEALLALYELLPPDHRRPRRHRLAVRPAGQRRARSTPYSRASAGPSWSRTSGCSGRTR